MEPEPMICLQEIKVLSTTHSKYRMCCTWLAMAVVDGRDKSSSVLYLVEWNQDQKQTANHVRIIFEYGPTNVTALHAYKRIIKMYLIRPEMQYM